MPAGPRPFVGFAAAARVIAVRIVRTIAPSIRTSRIRSTSASACQAFFSSPSAIDAGVLVQPPVDLAPLRARRVLGDALDPARLVARRRAVPVHRHHQQQHQRADERDRVPAPHGCTRRGSTACSGRGARSSRMLARPPPTSIGDCDRARATRPSRAPCRTARSSGKTSGGQMTRIVTRTNASMPTSVVERGHGERHRRGRLRSPSARTPRSP